MQNGRFPRKMALYLKKVCYIQFLCMNNVSNKVVRHSLAYLSVHLLFKFDRC